MRKLTMVTGLYAGLIVLMLFVSGCAGSGGGTTAASFEATPTDGGNVSDPNQISAPASLTYYSKTETVAPVSGWPTKQYTAKGSCVVYLTKTYCWDDGIKSVVIPPVNSYPGYTYTYSYWGLDTNNGIWGPCSGGCTTDLMPSPRIIAAALNVNMPSSKYSNIFSVGVATNVTCTEASGFLNCGDFTIDLNQAPL